MEKDSPSKPSVAELAGRFKGHILPMPPTTDESRIRRRPPCSLKLQNQKDENEDSHKILSPSNPLKVRSKNSALIEKLQANLALSPTALLPSPKSPDVKLQPAPLSPSTPQSPLTPLTPQSPNLRPPHQSSEEEDPVSFEGPPEGSTLPSINKTRARLSFKRRPPTRQHRRSAGDEAASDVPCPDENGLSDQAPHSPTEEADGGPPTQQQEQEEYKDCDTIEEQVMGSNPEDTAGSEEQPGAEQAEDLGEAQPPSEPCPAESEGQEVKTEEEMPEEAAQDK